MSKLLEIAFITTLVTFIFSGCASKVPPKNFALHNDTVQNIEKKDINIEVNSVKISGDGAPNKWQYFYMVEEEDIKAYLTNNINKFYNRNSFNIENYKVDVNMDFTRSFDKGMETTINATYIVYGTNQIMQPINIKSSYIAENTVTFGKIMGASMIKLFTGVHTTGEETNTHLKYDTLEKTAYAEDDTVALTALDGGIRLKTSYTGVIRLNFAKFLQKFNELVNSENQTLVLNK